MGTFAQAYESGGQAANEGILSSLVVLARIDGKVDEEEKEMLQRVARRLSLTAEQVNEIMKHPEEYPMIPPVEKEARYERFIQFIEMTAVDGRIDPAEQRMMVRYGIALGFDEDRSPVLADEVLEKVLAGQDREAILKSLL